MTWELKRDGLDVVRGWLDAEQLAKRQKADGPAAWWEIRRPERERAPEVEAAVLRKLHPWTVTYYRFSRLLLQALLDVGYVGKWLAFVGMWLAVGTWIAALVWFVLNNHPVHGAALNDWQVCAELLPSHREVFSTAAAMTGPKEITPGLSAFTCRLLAPSATGLAGMRRERDAGLNSYSRRENLPPPRR